MTTRYNQNLDGSKQEDGVYHVRHPFATALMVSSILPMGFVLGMSRGFRLRNGDWNYWDIYQTIAMALLFWFFCYCIAYGIFWLAERVYRDKEKSQKA